MTRHWRAVQVGVVVLAASGSALPAQSVARDAPPASVVRDTGFAGRNSVTDAARRLGITRAEVGGLSDGRSVASTGQTVKWVLIIAVILVGVVAIGFAAM